MENNNENKHNQGNELNINLPEDIAPGHYSNLAIIGHSPSEFVMDYASVLPGMPQGEVKTRVIMAPIHAKRLLAALTENIAKYESNFGEIDDIQNQNIQFPININGTAGQA